jgi:hypothetical protein
MRKGNSYEFIRDVKAIHVIKTLFKYKKIGKEKVMDKANEYVNTFKEEHNIKC